jgi:hypothetical protein
MPELPWAPLRAGKRCPTVSGATTEHRPGKLQGKRMREAGSEVYRLDGAAIVCFL